MCNQSFSEVDLKRKCQLDMQFGQFRDGTRIGISVSVLVSVSTSLVEYSEGKDNKMDTGVQIIASCELRSVEVLFK